MVTFSSCHIKGLIPKDENLLIHLRTVSEVTSFCSHLGLPDETCDTIKTEHPNDLGNQKFSRGDKRRNKLGKNLLFHLLCWTNVRKLKS